MREDVVNTQMFANDADGPGILAGSNAVTRTKQSSTLFVTNIPPSVGMGAVEEVFMHDEGFHAFRTVRRMAFADFESIRHATASMRLHQGHKFEGHAHGKGLAIDYDKDSRDKRNRQYVLSKGGWGKRMRRRREGKRERERESEREREMTMHSETERGCEEQAQRGM